MGAAIRSEIWACLAAGRPELAAAYAYEDACVDHADDGILAETFLAAVESAAFIESDQNRLLDIGLAVLPADSMTHRVIADTRQWWRQDRNWLAVRQRILDGYGSDNFTDCVMNMGFIVLAWLAGEGDFSRSICIAANCGMDTDCTAATVGAILGIMNPDGIDRRWLAPIGNKLVLNDGIVGLDHPDTLDDFTELILDLRRRLDGAWPSPRNVAQSTERLVIPVRLGFVEALADTPSKLPSGAAPEPTLPADAVATTLAGTYAHIPSRAFANEVLLLQYSFTLRSRRATRILFNNPHANRVWVDGTYCFGRDRGPMVPALNRPPADQFIDLELDKGIHTLTAAIRRPADGQGTQCVVGIGDRHTHQWIHDALLDAAHPAMVTAG